MHRNSTPHCGHIDGGGRRTARGGRSRHDRVQVGGAEECERDWLSRADHHDSSAAGIPGVLVAALAVLLETWQSCWQPWRFCLELRSTADRTKRAAVTKIRGPASAVQDEQRKQWRLELPEPSVPGCCTGACPTMVRSEPHQLQHGSASPSWSCPHGRTYLEHEVHASELARASHSPRSNMPRCVWVSHHAVSGWPCCARSHTSENATAGYRARLTAASRRAQKQVLLTQHIAQQTRGQ